MRSRMVPAPVSEAETQELRRILELKREMREKYIQQAPRRKSNFDYDYVLDLYRDFSLDFKSVGEKIGLAMCGARELYEQFFQPVVGLTGQERYLAGVAMRQPLKARVLPFDDPILTPVVQAAQAAGLNVERMPNLVNGVAGSHGMHRKSLRIQGATCRIHFVQRAGKRSTAGNRRYYRPVVMRAEITDFEAHVVHAVVPDLPRRFFVIPSYVLCRLKGNDPQLHLSIPIERYQVYKNRPARIDWWQYEGKWSKLEGEDD